MAYGRGISVNYCARNNRYIVTIGIIVTIAHVQSGDDRSGGAEFQNMTDLLLGDVPTVYILPTKMSS